MIPRTADTVMGAKAELSEDLIPVVSRLVFYLAFLPPDPFCSCYRFFHFTLAGDYSPFLPFLAAKRAIEVEHKKGKT